MKFFALVFLFSSLNAFAGEMIVKGNIVHDKSNPYSYQGDFVFTRNTLVTITLNTCTGGEDGRCYPAVKKTLRGVRSFPIPFEIRAPKRPYALDVTVRSAGGTREKVGDLVTEYFILVTKSEPNLEVKASGLEECGTENSGGFCLENED